MITVRDLQAMLNESLSETGTTLDSEVRYISRDRKDCSFETKWRGIRPGLTKSGTPLDQRYGDARFILHKNQNSEMLQINC